MFYGAILLLVYAHHNWIADFDSPPLSWEIGYGLAFALFSAAMTFTVLAVFPAFASSSMKLLDAMRPQAYGIFLTHYIFIIWLQYAVYDYSWPAVRQVCHRLPRHAGAELDGHACYCEKFRLVARMI